MATSTEVASAKVEALDKAIEIADKSENIYTIRELLKQLRKNEYENVKNTKNIIVKYSFT